MIISLLLSSLLMLCNHLLLLSHRKNGFYIKTGELVGVITIAIQRLFCLFRGTNTKQLYFPNSRKNITSTPNNKNAQYALNASVCSSTALGCMEKDLSANLKPNNLALCVFLLIINQIVLEFCFRVRIAKHHISCDTHLKKTPLLPQNSPSSKSLIDI